MKCISVDGIPIPLCCFSRAPQCQSFKGEAAYGYCAEKKQTIMVFTDTYSERAQGVITSFSLTAANGSEREA